MNEAYSGLSVVTQRERIVLKGKKLIYDQLTVYFYNLQLLILFQVFRGLRSLFGRGASLET
jgi:hypothetical protein